MRSEGYAVFQGLRGFDQPVLDKSIWNLDDCRQAEMSIAGFDRNQDRLTSTRNLRNGYTLGSRGCAENCQTAVCTGSSLPVLSRETVLGVGITTWTLVPDPPDSILIVPDNWRIRSRMPRIPTTEPRA
jgi:hypothetical protein